MNKCPITIRLSTQALTFRMGGQPALFEAQVRNDSDRQAQFQVEVVAAGAPPQSDWYRLDPEVSVAKPPGDVTTFQIFITQSPIPQFSGLVPLTVRVTSPQLEGEARSIMRLTVEAGSEVIPVGLNLLPAHVQAYPRNPVDIMVQVRNLSYQPIDVLLRISGVVPSWLSNGADRRVLLNAQAEERIIFPCQPPPVAQAPSQAHAFRIEAFSRSVPVGAVEGILEILPIGFIKFTVTPDQQSVPAQGWLPNWKEQTATFFAEFENLSNLAQFVNVSVSGQDQSWAYLPPVDAPLGLGERVKLPLMIETKRPWIGWVKRLSLQMTARLQGDRPVDIDPITQTVQLRIFPIIPIWLVIFLLALLATLLAWLLRPSPIGHTDFVNAVRFSDDLSLISGADDCTLRRWRVEGENLLPAGKLAVMPDQNSCASFQPQGVLAATNSAIRALAFSPRIKDRVAAGLLNGRIQFWNLLTQQRLAELPDDGSGDRVYDLAFTDDTQRLVSGHGSGKIQVWQRQGEAFLPTPLKKLTLSLERKYIVYALAISPDGRDLISAGSRNTLAVWNMADLDQPPQLLMPQKTNDYEIRDVSFIPNTRKFATADSTGEVMLWDLDSCLAVPTKPLEQAVPIAPPTEILLDCQPQDRWQAGGGSPLRSIHFSADGNQLVSAGADGEVKLWTLNGKGDSLTPEVLFTSSKKINTIDLIETEQALLIVSGDDQHQVKLKRIQKKGQ
jgi:hypothetical protein